MTERRETVVPEESDREVMREALRLWYREDHREFPWRETTDPYEILVSEVMSQQTQLDRVVDAWAEFVDRWPTVAELADDDRAGSRSGPTTGSATTTAPATSTRPPNRSRPSSTGSFPVTPTIWRS